MNMIQKSLFLTSILLVAGFSYAYADAMDESSSMMHDHMSNGSMMMHDHMSNGSMMMHDHMSNCSMMMHDHMSNGSMMMHDHMSNGSMMMHDKMNAPMYQLKHGVAMHDIKCGTNFSLIFKASD